MGSANCLNMKRLAWLPSGIRDPLVTLRNKYRQVKLSSMQHQALKKLQDQPVKKIIVGASNTQFEGWVPTNKEVMNLLV